MSLSDRGSTQALALLALPGLAAPALVSLCSTAQLLLEAKLLDPLQKALGAAIELNLYIF